MTEVKDYDKLCKKLDNIHTLALETLNDLPQDELTERLRKNLIDYKDGVQLIELSTEVLKLQLNLINAHPELYSKLKHNKE